MKPPRLKKHRYNRHQEDRMCDRKRKFKSGEASRMASKYGMRKYECPICGGWHLTAAPWRPNP